MSAEWPDAGFAALLVEAAPVETAPAAAIVARRLRAEILDQRLAAGERLRQDAVARRFGVSQTVAREAFRLLAGQGLVRAEPRRGVSVTAPTGEDAAELARLCTLVEPQALAWAIPRMTAADLARAGQALAELGRARSPAQAVELNQRFHRALYRPAGRPRALSLIQGLQAAFERYQHLAGQDPAGRARSHQEHRDLLELCRRRDVDGAAALLRHHVQAAGEALVARLPAG